MNGKTAKLLNTYSKESGRTRRDIKDWWKSLVEEDKDRARKKITAFIGKCRKEREVEEKKSRGGDRK